MNEFKVGDRVKIIDWRRSSLPERYDNQIVVLTDIGWSPGRVRFRKEGMWWTANVEDIELVIEMNRNGANEVFSEGANDE